MKEITVQQAQNFKKSYSYKMGGIQTLVFPNGQTFKFDDREYYKGRGAKYNTNIKHDDLGTIQVFKQDVRKFFALEKHYKKLQTMREKELKAKEKRYKQEDRLGRYPICFSMYGTYIELSEEEEMGKFFNPEKLANTLGIKVEDAKLLKSRGKTYVFAKNKEGDWLELYHASLFCNPLHIFINNATPERIAEFKVERESWVTAPYARDVGQTSEKNHYVC